MAVVKFVNSVKYKKVLYPAHCPIKVDDKDVNSLVSEGAIILEQSAPDEANGEKSIDDMKVDELKAYAEAHGIDISGVSKKSDIVNAIKKAEDSEFSE